MSTDLQDLLRDGLDRLTAEARVPGGLVGRAQQRNRQRRARIRAAIAAGTALAAAAAVTVSLAATGNQPRSAPVRTQTIADVATRTERALAAAVEQGKAIQVTRTSGRNMPFGVTATGPQGAAQNPSPSQRLPGAHAAVIAQYMVLWQYHNLDLQEGFSAAGRLVFVNAFGPVRLRSGKVALANYGAAYPVHIRWRTVFRGASLSPPGLRLNCQDGLPSEYPSWRASIAKALSCKLFHLAGRQYVDGVDAMTLAGKPEYGGRETLWVNPATFLPVRLSGTIFAGPGQRYQQVVTDFRFLPPTKANLAALHAAIRRAPIPATFRLLPQKYTVLAGGL
jgi:hypothetical protein